MTMLVMLVALTLVGCRDSGPDSSSGPRQPWYPKSGLPLSEPKQIYSHDGKLEVTLDAARRTIDVSGSPLGAQPFKTERSKAQLNGPTLHVNRGDKIKVTFKNNTKERTNIHYHGLHVSPLNPSDNVFRVFEPGRTEDSEVVLPSNHPVGTYWYHVHFHGVSRLQVMGGLSGLLIVEGLQDKLAPEFRGIRQRQLALREVQTVGGSIITKETSNDASKETTRLVNGLLQPRFSLRESEVQLWRLANIGSDLFYDISLKDHKFQVLAEDGNPVFAGGVRSHDHLVLPPGKRFDVLIEGQKPGSYQLQTMENGQYINLAQVTVTKADAAPELALPTTLFFNLTEDDTVREDLSGRPPPTKTREFEFSFGKDGALINKKTFNPQRLDVDVDLETVEEWTLTNVTEDPHPFHIHVNEFQVISINGDPYDAAGMQDVVSVPPGTMEKPGKVVIRTQFKDFPGWFVFHCHILDHEDAGMMQTIQVKRPGENPTPPPDVAGGSMPSHT